MTALTGSFAAPGVSGSIPYTAGQAVPFSVVGEWPRAIVNVEISSDAGANWSTAFPDYVAGGASYARFDAGGPPPASGATTFHPPGAGLIRLRCVQFTSGWMNWSLG